VNHRLKRRNRTDVVKIELFLVAQDKSTGGPTCWVGGDRRTDGASSFQAFAWNCGKVPSEDRQGDVQGAPPEDLSTSADGSGGLPRSSVEAPVMGVESRRWAVQCSDCNNPQGDDCDE
jgi:hypothetical protein